MGDNFTLLVVTSADRAADGPVVLAAVDAFNRREARAGGRCVVRWWHDGAPPDAASAAPLDALVQACDVLLLVQGGPWRPATAAAAEAVRVAEVPHTGRQLWTWRAQSGGAALQAQVQRWLQRHVDDAHRRILQWQAEARAGRRAAPPGAARDGTSLLTVLGTAHAEPPEVTAPTDAADTAPPALPAAVAPARRMLAPAPGATAVPPVDAAVFCPPQVARASVFLVQVYLYRPTEAASVAAEAVQSDPAAQRQGRLSLPLDVPTGARVSVRLEMPTLQVDEPDALLVWRGVATPAQFEVTVPADLAAADAIGRVRLAVDGVPVGTLRFKLLIGPAGSVATPVAAVADAARRYHHAFVSYASQDRAEVLRRVQAFRIAGLSVFQDVLDLDPGARWEQALYHEIDRCDVFLLFWSRAAAASEWVGREIDYALARQAGDADGVPAIQPVPIEGPPIVKPPPQLKGLHFNDALLAQIAMAGPTGRTD
jgi:TIR domain